MKKERKTMPSFRFSDFKVHHKVLITCFILLIGLAYVIGFAQIFTHAGASTQHIKDYYRGNEDKMVFEKPFKEMLGVTHVHFFGIPMIFFLLGVIFSITRVRDGIKSFLYVITAISIVADLAMPYLIRYVSPAFAPAMFFTGGTQSLGFLILMIVPLYEMWVKKN